MKKNNLNYRYGFGAKKDKKDKRDYLAAGITPSTTVELKKFRIPEKYPSKNQGGRGSCTSQAQTHHKERQEEIPLSARFVMALTKQWEHNKRWGAYTRNTFKVVKQFGACKEELYPEPNFKMSWRDYIDTNSIPAECYEDALKHKSKSYWRVENSILAIKDVLTRHKKSIVMSMGWYKNFNRVLDGILPREKGKYISGHAVEIVGFDDFNQWLIVKNSWGEQWGKKGDFYLYYDMLAEVIRDLWCSLDIEKMNILVDVRYGKERTWKSYLVEKQVAFNSWLHAKIKRLPTNREINALAYGKWDFQTVYTGINGDIWLYWTKAQAKKRNLIKEFIKY